MMRFIERRRRSQSTTWGTALALFILSGCTSYGPTEENVSPGFPYTMQSDQVDGESIAYYTDGAGTPRVLFLHGIPTSSYLWRNVTPIVAAEVPVAAFDLPGYGESSLDQAGDYSYQSMYETMATWLDKQQAPFVMAVTDLGSVLGIDYAMRNPDRVIGLVLVEAVFMPSQDWLAQLTRFQKLMFAAMRSGWFADFMILNRPRMQTAALNKFTVRKLSKDEKARHLANYADRERRRVVRDGFGPAAMPKGGISRSPTDAAAVIDRSAAALKATGIPILLLYAQPGFIVQPDAVAYARTHFKNLTVVDVGTGVHFLPEDQPTAIGEAISKWLTDSGLKQKLR